MPTAADWSVTMTRLFNDPADFPLELLDGFVAAYPEYVTAVHGGVVRSTAYDEVAVIVGGGTGHYPAFCGLVGDGLAHGAAMGNIFSSPSAQQAYSVGRAADRGKGVIFTFGNYAGDVLHFGEAARRLTAEGIPADCVIITDDVASAPADELHRRRGVAGDLTVFKTMGAAARAGYDFVDTVRVGRHANDRTRSFGVAFAGCTLPGADAPLFEVPAGMMSIGLGIHGEPGVSDIPIPTADELADLLVARLLDERPADAGDRVALLLNGLGTVKYEELFVLYRRIAQRVADAGLTVVSPDVGELCTSLDMAGVSLTFFWLDEELEQLWTSPSSTPAYRKGAPTESRSLTDAEREALRERAEETSVTVVAGTPESQELARRAYRILEAVAAELSARADELGRLDAIAGDGDHGIGMERGARAARDAAHSAVASGAGLGGTLESAGTAWAAIAGGTSGALWGAALRAIGERLGDSDPVDDAALRDAVELARAAVCDLGGATVGDKTMVDALAPYASALTQDGVPWQVAAALAGRAADQTRELTPRLGRARPLAARSVGTPDPGAVSLALVIDLVTRLVTTEEA